MRIDAMVAYLTHDQLVKVRFLNPLYSQTVNLKLTVWLEL